MRAAKSKALHRQKGVALIAVLLLLVFVLTIVGGLFYRHQIHLQKVTRSLMGEQALLFLLSAESWAKALLLKDELETDFDHLGETWARNLPVLPIEGGRITGCLIDMQGRFNLNSLGWYSMPSWEEELALDGTEQNKTTRRRILHNLLRLLEPDNTATNDARIAALVDWLDADAWLLSPDSAEDNEYLLREPAYRPANHALVELGELSLVQGFGAGDVVKLSPWVSTIGEEVAINVNTAPVLVLMALSPHISADGAEALMAARPFLSVNEFYTALESIAGQPRQTLEADLPREEDFVTVNSQYFALQAEVELAGVRMAYDSLIRRDETGTVVEVLNRTLRYIPAIANEDGEQGVAHTACQQDNKGPASQ